MIRKIHQVLQHRARPRRHAILVRTQSVVRKTHHQPAEPCVGDYQVGAASSHHHRRAAFARRDDRGHERAFVARLHEQIGRTADAESSVEGERSAGGNR